MVLTKNQCELLIDILQASIINAKNSGIPIHKDYYHDLDEIKHKLYSERQEAIKRDWRQVNLDSHS